MRPSPSQEYDVVLTNTPTPIANSKHLKQWSIPAPAGKTVDSFKEWCDSHDPFAITVAMPTILKTLNS